MHTANRMQATTKGAARTRALGRRLARYLRPGDVLLLQGALGAGKTTFAQGVGSGLHVEGPVNSPTFVLLAQHEPEHGGADTVKNEGALTLFHADLYRLNDLDEVAELHLAEQATKGVLLVEWPERGIEVLPPEHLLVVLEAIEGSSNERRITIVPVGDRYQRVLDGLGARS